MTWLAGSQADEEMPVHACPLSHRPPPPPELQRDRLGKPPPHAGRAQLGYVTGSADATGRGPLSPASCYLPTSPVPSAAQSPDWEGQPSTRSQTDWPAAQTMDAQEAMGGSRRKPGISHGLRPTLPGKEVGAPLALTHAQDRARRRSPQALCPWTDPSSTPRRPHGPGPSVWLNPSSRALPELAHDHGDPTLPTPICLPRTASGGPEDTQG